MNAIYRTENMRVHLEHNELCKRGRIFVVARGTGDAGDARGACGRSRTSITKRPNARRAGDASRAGKASW